MKTISQKSKFREIRRLLPTEKSGDLSRPTQRGFTRCELMAVLATMIIFFGIFWPALARVHDDDYALVDLENGRRMTMATQLYAADHAEFLPHPTWGTIPQGGDGWAYATKNLGRIPDGPGVIPDAIGDTNTWFAPGSRSAQQAAFFRIGQLAKYVTNQQSLICPKDFSEVRNAQQPKWNAWRGRSQKVTSYCWNACLIDGGNLPNDTTRKIGDFRAADIYLWEPAEQVSFYFNDAANLPGEGITQRHGGTQWGSNLTGVDWGGRGLIGRIGGSAEFMSWKTFVSMSNESVRPLNVPVIPPNSPNNYLWIGPAYGK